MKCHPLFEEKFSSFLFLFHSFMWNLFLRIFTQSLGNEQKIIFEKSIPKNDPTDIFSLLFFEILINFLKRFGQIFCQRIFFFPAIVTDETFFLSVSTSPVEQKHSSYIHNGKNFFFCLRFSDECREFVREIRDYL